MTQDRQKGPFSRKCRLPDCDITFVPVQMSQRYCTPTHRFDAARLRTAIPVAQRYLGRVLDQLGEGETPVVGPQS